jgi:hypothetical protein
MKSTRRPRAKLVANAQTRYALGKRGAVGIHRARNMMRLA